MAMMKKFEKEFIERTLTILEELSGITEYEVTLLLNCLLALVTLPIEREKESKIVEFQTLCNDKLKELKNERFYIDETEDENIFFRNIRNSIAHLNLKLEENPIEGKIDSVIFSNYTRSGKCNFKFSITVENLKNFAKFVAEEYLMIFNKSKNDNEEIISANLKNEKI